MPETWQQNMAQALMMTLPGSPCIYYGSELGMSGGEDPENRAPMRWDLVDENSNETLAWMKHLLRLRKQNRAFSIGEFRAIGTEKLLAFQRKTDRLSEFGLVIANATSESMTEMFSVRESKLMTHYWLEDELKGQACVEVIAGTIQVTVPPQTIYIFRPVLPNTREYTQHSRIQ